MFAGAPKKHPDQLGGAAKRVVLHLGMHKTGTSFVQSVLHRNAKELRSRGVRVIVGSESNRFLTPVEPDELVDDWLGSDTDTIVYSNENFVLVNNPRRFELAQQLRRTLIEAGADITTVVYVRHAVEWVPSMWAQYVKLGSTPFGVMSLDEFIADYDYGAVLARVAELSSLPDTIVRPYLRTAMKNGSIFDDFFETIGIGTNGLDARVARTNVTPSRRQVELALAYNRVQPTGAVERKRHVALLDSFMRSTTYQDPSPSVAATLTGAQIDTITDRYADAEATLTAGFIDSRNIASDLIERAPERYEASVPPGAIDQYLQNMMILSRIDDLRAAIDDRT